MRKVMAMVVGLVLVSAVATFAESVSGTGDKPAADSAKKACCKATEVNVCTMCKIGAKEAGKCTKCGMDLVKMHVLSCADGTVNLCSCKAKCKCTMNADGAKCSCGKDVVKIAVKDMPGCAGCDMCKKAAPPAEAK